MSARAIAFRDYWTLCKPRVVFLMLVTTWVGMLLATYQSFPWQAYLLGTIGIALSAGAGAVFNHLAERHIDTHMRRTQNRPVAAGRIPTRSALLFGLALSVIGLGILLFCVNPLTCVLTFLSLVGYAAVYTLFLKRATPQNIVIGGLAGATPPLLGWTTVTGSWDPHGLLLVLIIFTWTPPHFWALALYRKEDYAKAALPMLPVTHGDDFTKLCILLYTVLLFPVTALPFVTGMSGALYLAIALVLDSLFLMYSLRLYWETARSRLSLTVFSFSIVYLFALFLALLLDRYVWTFWYA